MDNSSADTRGRTPESSLAPLQAQWRAIGDQGRALRETADAVHALGDRLQAQESLQRDQSSQLMDVMTAIQALSAQVTTHLTHPAAPTLPPAPAPPPAAPVVSPREPNLASPRPFDGTFSLFRGFVMQCELIFFHQPSQFFSPAARVAFITSLTTGDALKWAQATLCARPDLNGDYTAFIEEFKRVFDHSTAGRDVGAQLMRLRQGGRTAAAYATEFLTVAAGSGWNDAGLRSAYRQGLSESIKDELVRDRPATLNELIALAIDVDGRIEERRRERARQTTPLSHSSYTAPHLSYPGLTPSPSPEPTPVRGPGEEPMQLGRTRLTPAERMRRRNLGLCLYCGERGHLRDTCPVLPKD